LEYIYIPVGNTEVNEDEHSLFVALRIGYMRNVWNKTPESIFQITRGQCGTR